MADRRRLTVLRQDPYLDVRFVGQAEPAPAGMDPGWHMQSGAPGGPGWYARAGAPGGAQRDLTLFGPYPSREAAIVEQGRQAFAELPSRDEWRQNEGALQRAGFEHPELFEPTVVVGQGERFRLAGTVRIDSFVKLEIGAGLYLGEYVHIASFAHLGIGGGVTIFEDGASAGSGVRVITGSNVYGSGRGCSAVAPDAEFSRSFVRVCRNAVLFAGAIVLPGVTIGQNAVVAAGSVVLGDVGPFEVWAGNPARFIKRMEWSVSYDDRRI